MKDEYSVEKLRSPKSCQATLAIFFLVTEILIHIHMGSNRYSESDDQV